MTLGVVFGETIEELGEGERPLTAGGRRSSFALRSKSAIDPRNRSRISNSNSLPNVSCKHATFPVSGINLNWYKELLCLRRKGCKKETWCKPNQKSDHVSYFQSPPPSSRGGKAEYETSFKYHYVDIVCAEISVQ